MFGLAVIAPLSLMPLTFAADLSAGHCSHDVDTIIRTISRNAKELTVTLNSDDLVTLATARNDNPGHYARAVYFSAYLKNHQLNMKAGEILIFTEVDVNRGEGYNPQNGQFVAPVAGDYWFSLDFLSMKAARTVYLEIKKNGNTIARGYANPQGQHVAVTKNVLIHLKKGDIVTVVNLTGGGEYHGGSRYTGFIGYLLPTY